MIVISGSLVLGGSEGLPLSHARIGWDNLLRGDVVMTASTAQQGAGVANIADPQTYNFWQPTALPANAEFLFPEAKEVNYCGIAAHNLTDSGCSIALEYHNGSDWIRINEGLPKDNRVIMFLFDTIFSNRWRIVVDGGTSPSIGVVYLGKALEMQRRIYQGHTPIVLSEETVIRPQRSEGGRFLGRSVIRQGVSTSVDFTNLKADWIRSDFDPFRKSAVNFPFFWAWRPDKFPNEVAYVWVNEDIVPTNSGPADLMSVSFNATGIIK
jgi:hypothetical protein